MAAKNECVTRSLFPLLVASETHELWPAAAARGVAVGLGGVVRRPECYIPGRAGWASRFVFGLAVPAKPIVLLQPWFACLSAGVV